MNKKGRRLTAFLLVLILAFTTVPVWAEEETVSELQSRYSAMDVLNRLRTDLGLRTLSMQSALNEAAGAHSIYMDTNRSLSSLERREKTGFTGVTPIDRMQYAGFAGQSVYELLAYRMDDYDMLLEQALHDPYRRYMLLYPGCDSIGFGSSYDYAEFLLGCRDDLSWEDTLVLYPYPGQQEVGNCLLKQLTKIPEEVRAASRRSQIGEPVTITYCCARGDSMEFRNLSISFVDTKQGREVAYFSVLPQENRELSQTLILYPLELYKMCIRDRTKDHAIKQVFAQMIDQVPPGFILNEKFIDKSRRSKIRINEIGRKAVGISECIEIAVFGLTYHDIGCVFIGSHIIGGVQNGFRIRIPNVRGGGDKGCLAVINLERGLILIIETLISGRAFPQGDEAAGRATIANIRVFSGQQDTSSLIHQTHETFLDKTD